MKHGFNLRWKLVLFTTVLAIITYTTSAFFIYVVYDFITPFWNIPQHWFVILTLLLGIVWSGILAYFAASIITKPLQNLEKVASSAAEGNLNQEVNIPSSNDEIRSLSIAVDTMLKNIRGMVDNIDRNFNTTNETVNEMKRVSEQASTHSVAISAATDDISQGAVSS